MVVGCGDGDGGTGSATDGQTGTASEASTGGTGGTDEGMTTTPVLTSTDGETAGETADVPTTGEPTTDGPTTDSPTTGGVVPCDSPEGCTGMGEGDLTSFTLPFFRGTVCVSDAPQPGDALAISMTTCVHPCLTVGNLEYKYLFRCTGGTCELALVGYYPGTVGTDCPADVFGEFPVDACVFAGPHMISTSPLLIGDEPFAGMGTLLVPFMTNEDVGAIAGGDDASASIRARIESHEQAAERVFPLNFAPENSPAPATCSEGMAGCSCRDFGL